MNEEDVSLREEQEPNGPPVGLEELPDSEEESPPESDIRDALTALREQHTDLLESVRGAKETLAGIQEDVCRLEKDGSILHEMHEANKKLSEDFHERELLFPVFHTLIGIADRCYQQIALAKSEGIASGSSLEADRIASLVGAREADLVEIESRLADFGIQRYLTTQDDFDPKLHKCIQRSKTPNGLLDGRVAKRFLPGYRRYEKVIRPECVSVYVFANPQQVEGEPSCQ